MPSSERTTRVGRAGMWVRKLERQRAYLARYGFRIWCVRLLFGVARRLVGLRALRGMTLEPAHIASKYVEKVPPFRHRRCAAAEFARLDGAEGLESESFYRAAAERGDWCHGMFDGGSIASYGWYATEPVPGLDGFWITFSPRYVYMHQGFTVPVYRGRQLHAYGMARAALEAAADGYRGLISFVEVQNEPSLRSVARLGYRIFGTCWSLRILGRRFTFASPGCAEYAFRLALPGDPLLEPRTATPERARTALEQGRASAAEAPRRIGGRSPSR